MAADHGAAVSANVATAAHAAEGTLVVGSNASLTSSLDELPGALIESATNPTVILTAGMLTLAGLTAVGRGPGLAGCASSAQLLFTNVRLIPCLTVESLSQTVCKSRLRQRGALACCAYRRRRLWSARLPSETAVTWSVPDWRLRLLLLLPVRTVA